MDIRKLWFTVLAVAGLGILVLSPGTQGPFLFDDYPNIVDNQHLTPAHWDADALTRAALGMDAGPLRRPVSMLSFAANAVISGIEPFPFKLTNILLHGILGALITLLVFRLVQHARSDSSAHKKLWMAGSAGLIWAVHPISVTSVLYVVQRMNLLAALFIVTGILAYLAGRHALGHRNKLSAMYFVSCVICGILGVLSKENAILLPLYLLIIEITILKCKDRQGQELPGFRRGIHAAATAGLIIGIAFLAMNWDRVSGGYTTRSFTLEERLLTEPRVLWHYLGMILAPNHYSLGLFLDDIPLSRSIWQPWTTLPAILGMFALGTSAILMRRRVPLLAFGLLFFLAGHLLESTLLPLEIAFEHRNYLPMLGIIIALVVTVETIMRRFRMPIIAHAILLAFAAYCVLFTTVRSLQWADSFMLAQLEAQHHPDSARAQTNLGLQYGAMAEQAHEIGDESWAEFYFREAAHHYARATELDPDHRAALLHWYAFSHTTSQAFPGSAREELLRRLENGAPTADTPGNLKMLIDCVRTECGFPADEFEKLLEAALSNPRNYGRMEAELDVIASMFFRDVRKNSSLALAFLARAVAAQPDHPRFRLLLVEYLVQLGRYKDARMELREAERIDTFDLYSFIIKEWNRALDRLQSNQT